MSPTKKDLLSIHLAVLLFGFAGLFGKWIVLPATIIVLGRVLFASGFLAFLIKAKKERLLLKTAAYPKFILLGAVLALHWVSFFQSIQVSTVAIGLLSFSTFPIFTTFLEPIFLKSKLKLKDVLLSLFAFIGLSIIVPEFSLDNTATIGIIWGVISGLTFAILSILNKKYVSDYSSKEVAFQQDTFAMLFLLPFLWTETYELDIYNIGLLIVLGVVFTAIAHTLFISGMKTVKATTASVIASLEPVYGILFAFFLLQEVPSIKELIGGVIILVVCYVASVKQD